MVSQIPQEERNMGPKVSIRYFTDECGAFTGRPLFPLRTLPDLLRSVTESWTAAKEQQTDLVWWAAHVAINESNGGNSGLDPNHCADTLVDADVIILGWHTHRWVV